MNAVDFVDPVTPSGSQGATNIASNLNAEADRKLRAAQIAAQSAIEQARIKAEERMQTAKLESEAAISERQISSTEQEHAKYQEFLAGQQQREIQAQERQEAKRAEREDKLIKETRAREDAANQKRLLALQAKNEAEHTAAMAEVDGEQKVLDQQHEMMMAQELLQKQQAGEKINTEELGRAFEDQAKADTAMGDLFSTAVQGAVGDTMLAEVENEQTLGKKLAQGFMGPFESEVANVAAAPVSLFAGIAQGAATLGKSLMDTASNAVGLDTTTVEKSALTDGAMLIERVVENTLKMPGIEGALASAGDAEVAKGAVRAAVRDVMLSVAAHNGQSRVSPEEADARATASLAKLKEVMPQAAIVGLFGALGKIESDPVSQKQNVEDIKATPSTNVRQAKKEAMLYVRKFANNFDRLTANGPAAVAKKPIDFNRVMSSMVGATSLAYDNPEEAAKKLASWGLSPERAKTYLESARKRMGDTPEAKVLQRQIDALEAQSRALGVETKRKTAEAKYKGMKGALDVGLPADDADILR